MTPEGRYRGRTGEIEDREGAEWRGRRARTPLARGYTTAARPLPGPT